METHKAIVKGRILKLKYYWHENFSYDDSFRKTCSGWSKGSTHDFVAWKEIWSGEINSPLLEVDELFYIEELDLKVVITERIRTNSGSYIYETDHTIEVIEDEETKESELRTETKIKEFEAKAEDRYEENLAYVRREVEPREEKSLFERWFG